MLKHSHTRHAGKYGRTGTRNKKFETGSGEERIRTTVRASVPLCFVTMHIHRPKDLLCKLNREALPSNDWTTTINEHVLFDEGQNLKVLLEAARTA